jgi:very-short-patch-repair endonuclease
MLREQCRLIGLPDPCVELKFHPTRRWRFDAAWPHAKIAVEIDGGVFLPGGGRHSRGAGYRADCEKYAEAAILGWRVIRVLPEHVKSGVALGWIERLSKGIVS